MGLLDAIIQSGEAAKRKIKGLLADPIGESKLAVIRAGENAKEWSDLNSRNLAYLGGKGQPLTPQETQTHKSGLLNIAGLAPINMIAYHGSPHKFDKFDMSKIGTGEGAQAYGHGLYFAESPSVAKTYQETLAGPKLSPNDIANQIQYAKAKAAQATDDATRTGYLNAVKALEESNGVQGSFYKVDIPDEAIPRMLDWDAKLSEQTPEVKKALSDIIESYRNSPLGDPQGLNVAKSIGEDELLRRGIPGIRYLDGNSRGAGTGTSNFVLFDDQLPKILERNGKPLGLLGDK